ncbi:unnamed protein product, partial [Iphiclides podalirius]
MAVVNFSVCLVLMLHQFSGAYSDESSSEYADLGFMDLGGNGRTDGPRKCRPIDDVTRDIDRFGDVTGPIYRLSAPSDNAVSGDLAPRCPVKPQTRLSSLRRVTYLRCWKTERFYYVVDYEKIFGRHVTMNAVNDCQR